MDDGFLLFAALIPFCTVVLATEYSHFFVVKKGNSSQRSFLCIINVAANIFCWKREKVQVSYGYKKTDTF